MKRKIAPHAHASEDKVARRSTILHAADALFERGGGDLPTSAEIAAAAGLAKGTVYLYFRTKEEIFAALLLEGWGNVMLEGEQLLKTTKGSRAVKIRAFLSSLVGHLESHPELLRLDALGYGVLERNMPHETLHAHKASYTDRLLRTAEVIERTLKLPAGQGVQLLMRSYAMTRGLWQSYQHAADTRLAGVEVLPSLTAKPFREELMEALTEYWRGALGSP